MDGIDARRVLVASLLELVERPKRIRANGIARRAVALHRLAAQVFQEFLGPNDILAKLSTALTRYANMLLSVACQLVARIDDGAHEMWIALGHPAKREKRRLHSVPFEERQAARHVLLDPARETVPILATDVVFECGNVGVIFHVDTHRVGELKHSAPPLRRFEPRSDGDGSSSRR